MRKFSCNIPLLCALVASAYIAGLHAESLQVGSTGTYADLCSAITAAAPGDVIDVTGPSTVSGCTITTPDLSIKGVGMLPPVTAESETGLIVAADNVTIENVRFEGTRSEGSASVAIDVVGGSLTLRNVRITGSDYGVKAYGAEVHALTIERSEIVANGSNIEVGAIARFALLSSRVNGGGALVRTAAAENEIVGNRLVSGEEWSGSAELIITGSAVSRISGNVLVRSSAKSTAGLLQYVDVDGLPSEISAERNTFVNATVSGGQFVELIGDVGPKLSLERNIFWGDTAGEEVAKLSGSNHLSSEDIFRADGDFRLNDGAVPEGLGASAIDDGDFPLAVATETAPVQHESPAAVGTKANSKAAIGSPVPSSVVLTSSLIGGSTLVFSNMVYLSAPAPAGGVTVLFTSSNPTVVGMINTYVAIPEGSNSGKFAFRTVLPTTITSVTITATANGGSAAAVVRVGPVSLSRVLLAGTQVGSNGTLASNRVELTGPAPAGGMVVSLSASSGTVTVPGTITVPAGLSSQSFSLTAGAVTAPTSVTIRASHVTGSPSASLSVLPVAVSGLLVSPVSTSGGNYVMAKVYLNGPAPAAGLPVTITSSNSTVLPLPTTITVPAGATEKGTLVLLRWVSANTVVSVTARTAYGSVTRTMTAIPTAVAGLSASAYTMPRGGAVTLSVTLSGPAPSGGVAVTLRSSSTALTVPSSVIIPAGSRTISVTGRAGATAGVATLTATGGGGSRSVTITVQ